MLAAACLALANPTVAVSQSDEVLPDTADVPLDVPLDEIVVKGVRIGDLQAQIQVLAEPGPTGQLARWKGTICPEVIGIDPAQGESIARRVAEVAQTVKLTRPDSCRPTMIIVITDDPASVAPVLAKKVQFDAGEDGQARRQRFIDSEAPVRWLSVTDPCGFGCPLPNSRIQLATSPAFSSMIVLVDAGQLGGYSLEELADYIAVVALTGPPPESRPPLDSILSLFLAPRSSESRFALTAYDRAFLHGLYESPPDFIVERQRAAILNQMVKDLATE